MSEDTPTPPDSVLGALPRSRPHRRSDKRTAPAAAQAEPVTQAKAPAAKAKPAAAKPKASAAKPRAATTTRKASAAKPKAAAAKKPTAKAPLRQPPQPRGLPPRSETEQGSRPAPGRRDLVATAVRAAAELTEMGLSAGARALRDAVSRLPRP